MTLLICEPSQRDVSGLHELIREHAAFERSTASLLLAELGRLLLTLPRPIHFLVAKRDDDLLGYAAITFDWSVWRARRYAHLDCLFVAQNHRGRGVGKSLLAGAKGIALAESVDRLEWQSPAWNEDAQRFYVREGAYCQAKSRFSLDLPQAAIRE